MEKYFSNKNFHLYLIGILVLIGFGGSLGNDLSLDDDFVINSETEKGISNIGNLLQSNYYTVEGNSYDYRPIVMISFAVEHSLFGDNYALSHLINLILYFFICLAVFKYLNILFGEQKLIVYASLILFVAHPIHSEVVLSLKNRDELFAALFGFIAINRYLKLERIKLSNLPHWIFVLFLFYLSFLSKKTGLSFVGIGLLSQLFLSRVKTTLNKGWPFIFSLFFLKFTNRVVTTERVQRNFKYFENPLYADPLSFIERIPLACEILLNYIQLYLIPYPLRFYYGYDQVSLATWSSFEGVISVILVISLLVFAIISWRKRQALGFGIIFFLATGMLYSNLLKPAVGIMAERFVFVPILGLCIAIAYLIYVLAMRFPKKKIAGWSLIIISIIFTGINMKRSGDWNSRLSLYEADIAYLENSAKANFLYAHELQRNQEVLKTPEILNNIIKHYERAVTVFPEYKEAANNLGWVYLLNKKNGPMAKKWFLHAYRLDSSYSEALYGLGSYFRGMNQLDSAVHYYGLAYQYNKKGMLKTAKYYEMTVYGEQKNGKALIQKGNELLDDGFDYAQTYNFIGNGYFYKNNIDSALYYFDMAYQKEPNNQQGVHIYKMASHYNNSKYIKKYQRFANLQQVKR